MIVHHAVDPVIDFICLGDCYPDWLIRSIVLNICILATLLIARRWWSIPIVALIAQIAVLSIETVLRASWGEAPFAYARMVLFRYDYVVAGYALMLVVVTFVFALKQTYAWAFLSEA